MRFRFYKMEACGNDFVILDHLAGIPAGFSLPTSEVVRICDRHRGVGCDQLMWLRPSDQFSAIVTIFNSDGSLSGMCGNGMRAVGFHLARRGPSPGNNLYSVLTDAGAESRPVAIDLSGEHPEVALGVPNVFGVAEVLSPYGKFARVEIGNPHAVFFGTESGVAGVALATVGPEIESHSIFPNRTNVEFVSVLDRRRLRARVWERGAGITLACGSGACAAVAAAEVKGLVDAGEKIEVLLPGGSVYVRLEAGWRERKGQALLSGPGEDVFSGEWGS